VLCSFFFQRYGFRSIMYGVDRRVVNVLAAAHERDHIQSGCTVLMDLADSSETSKTAAGNGASAAHQPPVVIKSVSKTQPQQQEQRSKFLGIF